MVVAPTVASVMGVQLSGAARQVGLLAVMCTADRSAVPVVRTVTFPVSVRGVGAAIRTLNLPSSGTVGMSAAPGPAVADVAPAGSTRMLIVASPKFGAVKTYGATPMS